MLITHLVYTEEMMDNYNNNNKNNIEFIFGHYRAIATQLIKIDKQISNLLYIYIKQ